MPPLAKYWALRTANTKGSSMTKSMPLATASLALCHLSTRAISPRCVKLPLITAMK